MSDTEKDFLKKYKQINWTFIVFQVIFLIFWVGYTYARINKIEESQVDIKTEQEQIKDELISKATKIDLVSMRQERLEMIGEIRTDIRELRTLVIQLKNSK